MKVLGIFSSMIFICLMVLSFAFGQIKQPTGAIQGKVIDADTKAPLFGTNISVEGTARGAASGMDGSFIINKIPVGCYVLRFDYIGYERLKRTDIIVRSERITFLNVELKMAAIETDEISVTAGYFTKAEDKPTSVINFSFEEIRRAPGSAGDVSRILMSLPSLAKVNDQSNNLIVRGGNPMENTFFIDNIEIPNINHFPQQGASGGPIGILNVDFIDEVSFHAGGFSALYGDKLSSIMNISFREGNRQEFDGQLDLNFSGFGGVFEGPLFKQTGSWLLSARRSYLDFVVKTFNVGSTVAPIYGDIQAKVVYDINANNKILLLGIFADDHNAPNRDTGEKNYMTHYGNQDLYQSTVGINWRAIWNKSGYSNTSLAFTSNKYSEHFYETTTGEFDIQNRSREQSLKLRNVNHFRVDKNNTIEFGIEAKQLFENYDNYYAPSTNDLGELVPELFLKKYIDANKLGVFFNYVQTPFYRMTLHLGIRSDYFTFNQKTTISPRLSFSYRLAQATSVNGAFGVYYQNLPLLLLAQHKENKNLKETKAIHYVLGFDHLLTENTKLTIEAYQKSYQNFPLDEKQPALFIIDKSFFDNYSSLIDLGVARSRGIELTIQKKLATNFYGLISAAYFWSQYKTLAGTWKNRDFDNRATFSFEGGYKPNNKWEFSLRWIIAGGVPYTPFDIEKSKIVHRAIYDQSKINDNRYPDYHSMNVRFDRRFHFHNSNIVFYLSVWNAYDHKNIANYFWNDKEQKPNEVYQWRLLPIFGIEWEF